MATTVSRSDVEAGVAAGSLVLVDALTASYFEQQHLPGAVNLAPDEVRDRAAAVLPDRHAAVVTYCASTTCPNSGQVARQLERLGYTDVRTYPGGIQDWVEAGLPVESGPVRAAGVHA